MGIWLAMSRVCRPYRRRFKSIFMQRPSAAGEEQCINSTRWIEPIKRYHTMASSVAWMATSSERRRSNREQAAAISQVERIALQCRHPDTFLQRFS